MAKKKKAVKARSKKAKSPAKRTRGKPKKAISKKAGRKSTTRIRSKADAYRIATVERYYGAMKAYVFERYNTETEFYNVISEEVRTIVEALFKQISKDVVRSPLNRRYNIIKFINLVVEGNASLTTKEGTHEFPFWHGSAFSFSKPPNKKQFFEALEKRKESLIRKLLDFEAGEMEYQGSESNKAEEISIESMRLYCEYPKSEAELALHATKKTRGKRQKNKARGVRPRNKQLGKKKRKCRG